MASAPTTVQENIPSSVVRPSIPVSPLAALVLMVAAFVPLVSHHLSLLWGRSHYQFFPMVFVGAAVLIWCRWPGFASLEPGRPRVTLALSAWCWCLLAAAEVVNSSWLSAVGAMFLPIVVLHALGGWQLIRQLLPAWILLWLIIPPPFGLDNSLVLALQNLTTVWSSRLLDNFGIYHMISGNVVEIGNRRLFVEEACTGINSLFSIFACAVFYVFFARVPWIRAILLISASVAWVLLANTARVFLIAYLLKTWNFDLSLGWRHDGLGFLLFGIALVMIWSTDRFLVFLSHSKHAGNAPRPSNSRLGAVSDTAAQRPLTPLAGSAPGSWGVAGAFACLLVFHLMVNTATGYVAVDSSAVRIGQVGEDTLPKEIKNWRREKFTDEWRNPGSAYGEFSKIWWYRGEGTTPVFAVDYPFSTYHELVTCYQTQGWTMEALKDFESKEKGAPAHYCEGTFKKSGKRSAYLLYCEFDHTGRVVQPDRSNRHESAFKRFLSWLDSKPTTPGPVQMGTLFQFQLFVESSSPPSSADMDMNKTRFFEAFRRVQGEMFTGKATTEN